METDELLPREIAEIEEESDPLLAATLEFEEAARYLDLEDWIIDRLRHSEREVTLNLLVSRDSGELAMVGASRVQHHAGGQPTMGPVRLSRDAHPHLVRAAAMDATWQTALLELPMGGAAGAVLCDPAELSERELQELARAYVHGLRGLAAPFTDVLTPGLGCNEQTMAWMLHGHAQRDPRPWAAVAGKPAVLWGIPGHYRAAAQGVFSLLRHKLGGPRGDIAGRRISLQGFGAVGAVLARLLHEAGARLVATADVSGGLYDFNGLDVTALERHIEHTGVLFGYPGADSVCNADVLEAECDALVLAAAARQISATNAGHIRAPLVIEATGGAVTRSAEQTLAARGATVVPCLIATAGAFIAAYAEWTQNTRGAFTTGAELQEPELQEIVATQVRKLDARAGAAARQHNVSLRQAALLLAVGRVAAQMRLAGRS